MEFKNGYNFMYQKLKTIYASKIGRPDIEDEAVDFGLTEEEIKNIKLVYENKNGLVVNFTGLPTADDKSIQATINGEPVIGPSGDDPTPAMVPFAIGDVLKVGDKIHFDTSKEAELIAWLENVDWTQYEEMGAIPMIANFDANTLILSAFKIDNDGNPFYAIGVGSMEQINNLVYAGPEVPVEAPFTAGFQNLDENGDVTLNETEGQTGYVPDNKLPCTIAEMYEVDNWNGTIIGKVAEPTPPGPEPLDIKPFKVGDYLNSVGTFGIDPTANIDSIFGKLSYHDGICYLITVAETGFSDCLLEAVKLSDMGGDGYLLITVDLNGQTPIKIIYATQAGSMEPIGSWTKGWQNHVDGVVNYNLGTDNVAVTEIRELESNFATELNGKSIGKIEEPGPTPPTPTTTPFEIGQVLEAGDIIHIDTSKTDELLAHLNSIDWQGSSDPMISSGMYPMMMNQDGFIIVAMNYGIFSPGEFGDDAYALICGTMSDEVGVIYNSFEIEGLQAGWHGLDSNSNIILNSLQGTPGYIEAGLPFTLETLYDIGTPTWNGGIISFGGHGPAPTPPPAPSMLPFEVDDIITDGQTIYVDRSKAQDLVNYMEAVATNIKEYESYSLLNYTNGLILRVYKTSVGYKLMLGNEVIYSTYTSLPDGYREGWNNVDINGNYTVNLSYYGTDSLIISEVNNPEAAGTTWNGVIVGK